MTHQIGLLSIFLLNLNIYLSPTRNIYCATLLARNRLFIYKILILSYKAVVFHADISYIYTSDCFDMDNLYDKRIKFKDCTYDR